MESLGGYEDWSQDPRDIQNEEGVEDLFCFALNRRTIDDQNWYGSYLFKSRRPWTK